MLKRKEYAPEFKATIALSALIGNKAAAELASRFGVYLTMKRHCQRPFIKGMFEHGERINPCCRE